MRRRRNRADLTAADLAAVWVEAQQEVARQLPDRSDPRRPALLGRLLAEHGTDAVACIRARRDLRRGRRRTQG